MKPPSNREKKRTVNEGVRRLLSTPGWNPYARREARAADEAREGGGGAGDRDRAYADAEACPDCREERRRTGDATALCERHLAEAMGV